MKARKKQTDEKKLRRDLDSMIGTNKELKNLIFDLEQLIFREIELESS